MLTPCACKNTMCIQILMASEFCRLIFCLLVDITSCIHGLCAGNPSDLNEWLPCSSQTACIRPVITHVHPPGDVNRSIRASPKLRALLPTSCVQGVDIMMIIDRNEGAKSLEEATFPEQCAKKSVRDDYVRPFSQLVVWKCLSFVFLHSHLKGLFLDGRIRSDS